MMIFDDATQTFLLDSFIVLGFVVFGVLFFLNRRSGALRPLRVDEAIQTRIRSSPDVHAEGPIAWSIGTLNEAATALRNQELQKRSAVRRDGNPVDVHVLLYDGAAPVAGKVLNRSRGGIRLVMSESVPVTSLLKIRANHAPDDSPWVEIEVRHVARDGAESLLGCRFTQEHSWGSFYCSARVFGYRCALNSRKAASGTVSTITRIHAATRGRGGAS